MTNKEAALILSDAMSGIQNTGSINIAYHTAISALINLIPKVLTLEEVCEYLDECKPVLLQVKWWAMAQWYGNGDSIYNVLSSELKTSDFDLLYGVDWRCWNVLPDPEQLENTPWNVG